MNSENNNPTETAVFGGGCFWCTEAVFKMINGVISVEPGYTGGTVQNPTYDQVCGGNTGHAEAVRIQYDPSLVKYETLLTVFFGSHDPTTLNRQGGDIGTQYRSAIFYTNDTQEEIAQKFIDTMNASNEAGAPVVTTLEPLKEFYVAENYHKDYFANHPEQPYCMVIINPKLEKVQKEFAHLLKTLEN